jgi:3-hydroxyisobutyrate dehydrogenase
MMKVAVLGLGTMGAGMAGQLLDKGFAVTVWNRSAGKAQNLVDRGAKLAATPADAASGAEIVVAMVADDRASHDAWLGPNGALAAMDRGAIAIESSTVTVDWIKTLAARAGSLGVELLDGPVSGSKLQANSGNLRFLVGGAPSIVERARPALEAMGSEILSCGPTGSGALLKLINNYMCGVQIASLAESLALAERSGLDIDITARVLTEGAPGSPMVKTLARRMIDRDYAPNFVPALMAKDLRYAAGALAGHGIVSALANAAGERFLKAVNAGYAEADMASVVEPLRLGDAHGAKNAE